MKTSSLEMLWAYLLSESNLFHYEHFSVEPA